MAQQKFPLAQIPTPLFVATGTNVVDCNHDCATLLGYADDEIRSMAFKPLALEALADAQNPSRWSKPNGTGFGTFEGECIVTPRDGEAFWCKVQGRTSDPNHPSQEAVYSLKRLNRPLDAEPHKLTKRQSQIVTLVADGNTSQQIADQTGLSVRTVEAHRARIMRAVGVRNVAELISWFQSTR